MASQSKINLYSLVHQSRLNDPAQTEETLNELCDRFAEQIQQVLRPTSVLDASCARGYLVRALRKLGIEAWGIDSDKDLIQNVLQESRDFCQIGALTQPVHREHYDLVLLFYAIDHLSEKETSKAIKNLCNYSDDVLFAFPPPDADQSSHSNIHPPEYWASVFFHYGFVHDLDVDLSSIAPGVMRFCKSKSSPGELISYYEQKNRMLTQENELRRSHGVEQILELSSNETQNQHLIHIIDGRFKQAQAEIKAVQLEAQTEIRSLYLQSQKWKVESEHMQARLADILDSTSWRFMTRVQSLRLKLIPLGSRREAAMRMVIRGVSALRREGPFGFLSLASQKTRARIELDAAKSKQKRNLHASDVELTHQIIEIDDVASQTQIVPHISSVDIIICVHNALEDVQRCLDSLLQHTTQPYRLILVDDGSDEITERYLREFSQSHRSMLLRSDTATGYTCAANRGMRASSADFVVLLNSDTILTPDWLDRSIACIQSNERIGIVGPLSNTASWQSVPKIEQNGDWATNPLPEGVTPAYMAQLIAANSGRLYPEMPLLNGFCLILRRSLLEKVGLFDEEHFGKGYGEEDDLVLRARKQGWKMALADDVYIYHAQSKSYSSEKRHALSERAGKILREKHGAKIISQGIDYCQYSPILEGIRARARVTAQQDQCISLGKQYFGKKMLFILPINVPGGGANVIRSESLALQQMGVKVEYFNLWQYKPGFEKVYPDLSQDTIFGEPQNLEEISKNFDAVIATYNPTVSWLLSTDAQPDHPVLGYYVQGFEPWMYVKGSQAYKTALESYTLISDMRVFTKTEWTQQQVKKTTGRDMTVIGPSVDIALNRPRAHQLPTWPEGPLRIAAMIRPESPYREPLNTMLLLDQAVQKYKGQVEILLFGTTYNNPGFIELPHNFPFKIAGILSPGQVANLLSRADIFVDYSTQQAMGLTAMEAMACGCAVIIPEFGGASSYGVHEHNSLIVDMSQFENVWEALKRLVEDEKLRTKLRRNAIYDICHFFPEQAALNMLNTLFGS